MCRQPLEPPPLRLVVAFSIAAKTSITEDGWEVDGTNHSASCRAVAGSTSHGHQLGGDNDGANSGGVPLPEVTIYDADGEVTHHFEECDLYAPGNPRLQTELLFPALPIADHRSTNPPYWSTSSNFNAPSDTMANADVQYLATVYSRRFGDIFLVRAKFLTAPNTREGEPHSAKDRDVRLYTLCTYNIWAGSAIDCMLENEMRVDSDGYYTLVISDESNRPNNLTAESATWIDWGPYLDGQLSYRHVYRENPIVQQIARGVLGKSVSDAARPYVPIAIPCTRETFDAGGWSACKASIAAALANLTMI